VRGFLEVVGLRRQIVNALPDGNSPQLGTLAGASYGKCESATWLWWSKVFGPLVNPTRLRHVIIILSILTVIRLWAAAYIGLAPDETYYWLWSQSPALGYSDHPPVVAWSIWLSTKVLGDSAIGIRMPSILSALVTSAAVFGTAHQLFSSRSIALRAVLWFNAMILIGVGAIFITPDAPSTMFWALAVWALSVISRGGSPRFWLLVGLFAGLGCDSKYTNFFLGLGIFSWILVDPSARRWLSNPWFAAGGVIAALIFLPVFLWNAQHDWISFSMQFGRLGIHEVTARYLGEYLISQVGLLNPIVALFFGVSGLAALKAGRGRGFQPGIFLIALMSPLLLYMTLHALHDRVQANWLAPVYPLIAILAASGAENIPSGLRTSLAQLVVPLGTVVSVGALMYLAAPISLPLSIESPAARLEGWRNFSANIESLSNEGGAGWVATANYDVNAELSYYQRGAKPVREIAERYRYEVSVLDKALVNQTALLVLSERQKASGRFDHCFASVEPISEVSRQGANGVIERYIVELAWNAPVDIISAGCHKHHSVQE
jgi:4-amino-4-deoxy-L-arabinose transferase-like glycosyltransferase